MVAPTVGSAIRWRGGRIEEVDVRQLVAALAFLSSVAAFLVIAGTGLLLLSIASSGERGTGAMLTLAGAIGFASALILIFARHGAFAGRGGRAGAVTAALLGALPAASLSVGVLRFSGLPLGGPTPLIDWSAFALGLVLALGAASILALGYWRVIELPPARTRTGAMRPPPVRSASTGSSQAVPAPESPLPAPRPQAAQAVQPSLRPESALDDEDDVRVTPVELPSIGRFRRR